MKFSRISEICFLLAGMALLTACRDEPSVQKYRVDKTPVPVATAPVPADSPAVAPADLPYSWVVPAGWEPGKPSSMRTASYNVPLSTGETGDFSLVQLGGGAGGILANINRWRGQIGLGGVTAAEVSELAHNHTTLQGESYLHITLVNPEKPESAILAAIFEQPGFILFAKLTASQAGVEEAQESFEAFCNSIRFKDV